MVLCFQSDFELGSTLKELQPCACASGTVGTEPTNDDMDRGLRWGTLLYNSQSQSLGWDTPPWSTCLQVVAKGCLYPSSNPSPS